MSRVKLLVDVISDVRSLADSLQALADAMTDTGLSAGTPVKEEKKPEKKEITLEEVRGKLAEISQSGKIAQVKDIINKYGGAKLSDIDPAKYADVLKEAEVIADAG